jgi:hypothetical protein
MTEKFQSERDTAPEISSLYRFSLKLVHFRCTEIFPATRIVQNELRLPKRGGFLRSGYLPDLMVRKGIFSDVIMVSARLRPVNVFTGLSLWSGNLTFAGTFQVPAESGF